MTNESPPHGGNIDEIARGYRVDPKSLIDFSANINPLGPPQGVRRVLQDAASLALHYPDPDCTRLAHALAKRHRVEPGSIIVGNGSTELIYLFTRASMAERAAIVEPTFTEFERALARTPTQPERVFALEQDGFQLPAIQLKELTDDARSIYLCNPNNPTGALASWSEIADIADSRPNTTMLVDEAFMDFVELERDYSCTTYATGTANVIALRSMTKFFAMPGLRLGYAIGPSEVVDAMAALKPRWSVNAIALAAGAAALEDSEYAARTRAFVREQRESLMAGLAAIDGLAPFPSAANFILVKIMRDDVRCDALRAALIPKGIVIRHGSNFRGLGPAYFRVAVRTASENERLLAALDETLAGWS